MNPRRLIPRLLLCLALGLLTTILVAWFLAAVPIANVQRRAYWSSETARFGVEYYSVAMRGARRCVLAGPDLTRQGLMQIAYSPQHVSGWAVALLGELTGAGAFPEWWGAPPDQRSSPAGSLWAGSIQDARGWPFLALWCEWPVAVGPGPSATSQSYGSLQPVRSGIELPHSRFGWGFASDAARALPLRPIWRGLTADTLFFALPWLVVLPLSTLVYRTLRARRRRSRNLCPYCAYSRAGLDPDSPCPECGHAPNSDV